MNGEKTPLTPLQAWDDFCKNVKPIIWNDLSDKQKNRIINADRDKSGKRKNHRDGKPLALGVKRIERILAEHAPGRYRIEQHVVFYLNE